MPRWEELPAEILDPIFMRVAYDEYAFNLATNLEHVFQVCKAWRIVALRIAFKKVKYFETRAPFNESKNLLWNLVKNEIAGHSTKKLIINSVAGDKFKDVFLHFATYCPNVSSFDCYDDRKLAWDILADSKLFEKLNEIPSPGGSYKEMQDYFNCALQYRDQLEKLDAFAFHPLDPNTKIQSYILQGFSKIQTLTIQIPYWSPIFYVDEIIDACPQIVTLGLNGNRHAYRAKYETPVYNEELYKPHKNIVSLNFHGPFETWLLDYLVHKLPNVKGCEIKFKDNDLSSMRNQSQYISTNLNKLLDFTARSYSSVSIYVLFSRFKETLANANVKSLALEFCTWITATERLTSPVLNISKGVVNIIYPVQPVYYNSSSVLNQELIGILQACPNIASLKFNENETCTKENPFDIFRDVFEYGENLVKLVYMAPRILLPTRRIYNGTNLKALTLNVRDIYEDVYTLFSKVCPRLNRMSIRLNSPERREIYIINMPETHFKLFELCINFYLHGEFQKVLVKVKTQSGEDFYTYTEAEKLQKVYFNWDLLKTVGRTVELTCASVDSFVFDFKF